MTASAQNVDNSLSQRLQAAVARLPQDAVSLAEIRDRLGHDGMLLLTIFMTLVFMVPVSIPGVSTVFGAAITVIGLSRLLRRNVWLPQALAQRKIAAAGLRNAFERSLPWLQRLEKASHPGRLPWLYKGPLWGVLHNLGFIAGAVLLMAPFGFIPFSNTLPAVAVLLFAIGFLQSDGRYLLLAHAANIGTTLYFSTLIGGLGVALHRLLQYLQDM